jgi:hypothetical protein
MILAAIKVFLALLLRGQICTSTVFGYEDDPQKGGKAYCIHRNLRPDDVGVAHRTLPCGTQLAIYNPRTGKMTTAVVVDRGPYGAVHKGEWVLKRTRRDPGRWRGCLDLTEGAARLLGHNGYEKVVYALLEDSK